MEGSNFFDNILGTIAGYDTQSLGSLPFGNLDFGPKDNKGNIIKFRRTAKWMGMESPMMQKYAYEFCAPVGTVVDKLTKYDLSGRLEINRKGGKGKDKELTGAWADSLRKLLDQPNILQSYEQWRGQQVVYKKVFGFCPVLPIMPIGFRGNKSPEKAFQLVNLPPWLFKPIMVANSNIVEAQSVGDIVSHYELSINGKVIKLDPSEVIILKDGFMQNSKVSLTLPLSRLVGLDMAVSNYCAAMEADNVLLRKKGPLGFISHDPGTKDITGYQPLRRTQKAELQRALDQYGLSWDKLQYVISRQPMRWNPMSFNVKDLDTTGTIVKSEKAICHKLGLPYALYEETENTYANDSDNALATCYQTEVIPDSNRDWKEFAKFFKAIDNNAIIATCFDHIGALQEDKQAAAITAQTLSSTLQVEYDSNIITKNQWLIARGYEPVPDGDTYKTEGGDPLAVKLGVGGLTGLIEVLTNPLMTKEVKQQTLILVFGIEPADAAKLATDPAPVTEPTI